MKAGTSFVMETSAMMAPVKMGMKTQAMKLVSMLYYQIKAMDRRLRSRIHPPYHTKPTAMEMRNLDRNLIVASRNRYRAMDPFRKKIIAH